MDKKYDLVIIGSGPGGYVAALKAAELGFKTACVEKSKTLGGVCLNVGCIPSKALLDSSEHYFQAKEKFADHGIITGNISLDLKTMMGRKEKVVADLTDQLRKLLENNKIDIVQGTGTIKGENQVEVVQESDTLKLNAKNILLATGSIPAAVPGLEFDGQHIISSTEALSFEKVPGHLCIVGGGFIGLELGSVWARLGAEVTIIEMLPRIAGTLDGQIIRTLERILKKQGLDFKLNTRVTSADIADRNIKVSFETKGENSTLECDKLLVAVGRRPMTLGLGLEDMGIKTDKKTGHIIVDSQYRTNIPSIYAIGDLIPGPALAHKASAEGSAAVENMAGLSGDVNYNTMPSVVYTWPEAGCVGITKEQAKEQKIPHKIGSFPFGGTGRARCMGETDGFVKIISHSKTDRVLGVHILGPRASDLIAECVLAMEFGASSEDIARTVHSHPTFSEAVMEAAMSAWKH
ncbi:Dihydrolipoyl dehydrogenase (E3 component of 2-oxoglutarate dehydrogenase complex) [Desulfonema limicola]|uniref:Dihydrolipoyl dehydrogenase n=1 Tax=Desulfonema limicola TaxID=45656 RepID=A0A975B4E2_9BACT|nr:dihydrolipoyl dehydrogenase [Desulfonema limicola]QTA78595.1 Dihydrolipoyl dehydrogenase (E3 component of 2-oxoglutarate dehydrogenase complex) [Desulfonema limicola]